MPADSPTRMPSLSWCSACWINMGPLATIRLIETTHALVSVVRYMVHYLCILVLIYCKYLYRWNASTRLFETPQSGKFSGDLID